MRLQLALNVRDLEEAVTYCGKLFATEAHKRRPGYANFVIEQPPLKLVLFENADAPERLNHLGMEVGNTAQLATLELRLDNDGVLESIEHETHCCHAVQNKLWSHEPQGLHWEWYEIVDDEPINTVTARAGVGCCG